jgi:uncharacterized spore protein YtfJ
MDVQELVTQARDAVTVKRVFGEPYEKNGVTVIPAARIGGAGGGGGGEGEGPGGEGSGKGSGSGFGLAGRPAGAYVIRGEEVRWQPAIDVNRVILGAQLVAIAALLTLRTLIKTRAKAKAVEALASR